MIEIRNLTRSKIQTALLKKTAERILKREGKAHLDVSVALLGAKRAQELNRIYRGKNYPANVLSFPEKELGLGEIVLCPFVIRKDALEYKISFKRAVSWMFVHGLLHLLGYDHKTSNDEKKMTQKEQQYLS
ncbi:rRNA maturation RNase YbeY [Patescibacteria group bacterium]|nr:rRNA maturation RNase YbeY [Patescibacteria group bacterium]